MELRQVGSNETLGVCRGPSVSGETAFLTHLAVIERAIGSICRRNRLRSDDGDDFASVVKLRIIEDDYAIIRKFEGRCSFEAYISIVIQRMLFDYRIRMWGKWHPSAEARKMGDAAVMLEILLCRDERTAEEAVAVVTKTHPAMTMAEISHILGRLPRRIRRREVEVDCEDEHLSISADTVCAGAFGRDRLELGRRTAALIKDALAELPATERTMLRMRFEAGMTVAEISRALHVEQKPLYRILQRQLLRLRQRLQSAGISADDADELLRAGAPGLDLGFDESGQPQDPSSGLQPGEDEEEGSADETGEWTHLS